MLKIIDLCAGIGGIRRGFELTEKFKTVLSCENDKFCCKTYKHLYGEDPSGDITTQEFKDKVRAINYDILTAGFPCQSFSIAGERKGFEDKIRGTIFFDIAEIIKGTKPKVIFLENVGGLVTHDKGNTIKVILDTLIELGYKIPITSNETTTLNSEIVRCTRNFGLPQKRSRTYIVGFRNDTLKENYTLPIIPRSSDKVIYESIEDVLEYGNLDKYYLSQQYLETLKKHKKKHKSKNNGFGYFIINENENKLSNTLLATGGSGKEKNLVRDYQSEIIGKVVKNKKTPLNDECIRVATPDEWAKLQGFKGYAFVDREKDKFSFPEDLSDAQRYKQLGNSVSIPVIEEIAKYILKVLEDNNEEI